MGNCCAKNVSKLENNITFKTYIEKGNYEEIFREEINKEKLIIHLKSYELNKDLLLKQEIKLDVIHVDSTRSTMSSSEEYINQGNEYPFIYNTIVLTVGTGKGNREGGIVGNLYTSTGIPLSLIKTEFRDEQILVKITAISIVQQLNKLVDNQFFFKNLVFANKR